MIKLFAPRRRARFVMAALAATMLPGGVAAQTPAAPAPAQPKPATQHVALTTSAGTIVLELETTRAPKTAANFLKYVDQKKYDGATFYRAMKIAEGQGIIQGGTNGDPKRVLPPVAHESTTTTGLSHKAGTISLARAAPGSGRGDFFILMSDIPSFDADPKATGDNQGFAAFGRVVAGMDVARTIFGAPIDPARGTGFFKGQLLAQPVVIRTARRVKAPPPPVVPSPPAEVPPPTLVVPPAQ